MRKLEHKIGNVFQIELEGGVYGYGRVLKIEERTVFIELYKINTKTYSFKTIDEIVDLPVILSIWSTDVGLKKIIWKVLGNVQITDEVVMPSFWKRDAINHDKYYIIKDDETIEVTKEQIGDAQPYGIFGHDAVRLRYAHELKLQGLM